MADKVPEEPLTYRLALAFDRYRDEREQELSSDPLLRELVALYDEVSKALLLDSSELVVRTPDEDGKWRGEVTSRWDDFLDNADRRGVLERLEEGVEIHIANDLIDRLPGATERCFELARFVLYEQPGEPVGRYLSRLGRCYIAGFLPECVILCRAVVENAVKEAFERRSVPFPATEEGASSLTIGLRAAHGFGWLSRDGLRAAHDVRIRGNQAIHHDPLATTDVLGTIKKTNAILVELYGT